MFDGLDLAFDALEGLPKLLRYPGGKHRVRKKLLRIFPRHRVYVEPFAGGASLFFEKDPVGVEVLNDISRPLMDFYRGVARGGLRRCRFRCSRKRFKQLRKKYKAGRKLTPCEYFQYNKCGFSGHLISSSVSKKLIGVDSPGTRNIFENLRGIETRLKHTKLHSEDFAKVMKKYDGLGTLFYLDPPYESAIKKSDIRRFYPGGSVLPARVKRVVRTMKGKVVLSYGDTPDIRKLFCKDPKFQCHTMDIRYSMGQKADREVRELVITNWKLKKRKRR